MAERGARTLFGKIGRGNRETAQPAFVAIRQLGAPPDKTAT
jgi:hypothetical protein